MGKRLDKKGSDNVNFKMSQRHNLVSKKLQYKYWATSQEGNQTMKRRWFINISPETFFIKIHAENET